MPSTVVRYIHYDVERLMLTVGYQSEAVYEYYQVPPEVYEQFKSASSKGMFLNHSIKTRFRYKRIK